MDKVIYTGDNDALVQACGGVLAVYFDSDLVKSAASDAFSAKMLKDHVPDDDHFGVHLIAMGCGEDYGFNKNGDFWTRAGLMNKIGDYGTHTFVKFGHYFLEHRNSDPKLARGKIVAAAYNEPMQRAELVIHGNKRKAEEDYHMAKSGKTLTFSMSARVPDDECSCCGHRAKKSSLYCRHLKLGMTQWQPQFSKFAYAVNHKPRFFDISRVKNPADRIAHWLAYIMPEEEMAKAASTNGSDFLFSDLQARLLGVNLPEEVQLGCSTAERQAILEKFASAEDYLWAVAERPDNVAKDQKFHFAKYAAPYAFDSEAITDSQIESMRRLEPGVLFGHLAKRAAVLPFLTFFAYVNGMPVKKAAQDPVFQAAQELLPGMFKRAMKLPADASIEELFTAAPSVKMAAANTGDPIDKMMDEVAEQTTIDQPKVNVRIIRICSAASEPCGCGVKSASKLTDEQVANANAIVQAYAMYKVAFAESALGGAGQLSIDGPSLLLITSPQKL